MIAVTFALPSESSEFIRRLTHRSRTHRGPVQVTTGECDGHAVSVLHTGVGEIATRERLAAFLAQQRPELLISSGFAGALNDSWKPGQLLLARNVSSSDAYASAAKSLPDARPGNITTARAIVDSPTARADLASSSGADAVDMESETIADACTTARIPMLSLRAISDTPVFPLPAPPAVLFNVERQRTEFPRLLIYVAKHPSSLARFMVFARQIAAARRALADALQLVIGSDLLR